MMRGGWISSSAHIVYDILALRGTAMLLLYLWVCMLVLSEMVAPGKQVHCWLWGFSYNTLSDVTFALIMHSLMQ